MSSNPMERKCKLALLEVPIRHAFIILSSPSNSMMLSKLPLLAALVASGCVAKILPPSQDSWPGELIRFRQLESKIQPLLPFGEEISVDAVYQYLFRTTDSLGNAVAAVTTLIAPHNSDSSKLLVYQAAYDAANGDCSPSYTLRLGSSSAGLLGLLMPNSTTFAEGIFLAAALNRGWWVMVTDYEGLEAQFIAGLQSAYATLDSVRVVINEGHKIGLAPDARYVIWGYSGGAFAGGWAAELQPSYAPELHFSGAALGGTIVNTTSVVESINRGTFSGLIFRGFYGAAKAYPNLTDWMDENMLPNKRDEFFKHATNCQIQGIDGRFHDVFSYFVNGDRSIYEPVPATVLDWSGQMGRRGSPTMPLFIYKAVRDEISPIEDTDKLVHQYCSNGATIEYHRNAKGEHVTEALIGSVNALEWVSDRLAGRPLQHLEPCLTKDVLIANISPSAVSTLGIELYSFLRSIQSVGLGPPS
ncbi:secretory lipase [Histoplasma capsulatum H143]|uniref:Secretory lipase n=1 Tax=Ajellomyces capsulatus (strain H143) TaxID=544712 RepID=C6HLU8_AJECH|nr:secretory lipase [Histoplasma capsulatum H143]